MRNNLPLSVIVSFCSEMIQGHGEDSYCHGFCDNAGMVAVFDGCGGAGARKHAVFSDHTEAYVASRLCSGAFYDYFCSRFPTEQTSDQISADEIKDFAIRVLKAHEPSSGNSFSIRGSMVRTLPTTAACAIVQAVSKTTVDVTALWAGDSRVYVMDACGLSQLSVDDTTIPDPMDNLYEDGVLQNIFCSDRPVTMHKHTVRLNYPCIVIAATDGCFGYVTTPMEFEGILVRTLLEAHSAEQWEDNLKKLIGSVAGDDQSLCMAALGFDSFENMKRLFSRRYITLNSQFLEPVSKFQLDDQASRKQLWLQYKPTYCRFMKDGIDNGRP